MRAVRYVGAGEYVPPCIVTNESIARAIPGWEPSRIEARTGIVERRFLWEIDEERGRTIPPPASAGPSTNTDMAEIAVRMALDRAGVRPQKLDGLCLITSTPDEIDFCSDAVELHGRLGCRADAWAIVVDSGCGGLVYLAHIARKLILSGQERTIALVASNFASAYLNREIFTSPMPGNPRVNAFLSMYLFGDGAGALILRGDEGTRLGVMASAIGTERQELVVHRAGGALHQPGRASVADHAFFVDGTRAATAYGDYMHRTLEMLRDVVPEIRRYYLHQANKRVLCKFAETERIPLDRVAFNVHRYGNTSAASTALLFSEDVGTGRVQLGSGEPVLFAAVGAGVHFGGQVVCV